MAFAVLTQLIDRSERASLARWGPDRLSLACMAAAMITWTVIEDVGGHVLDHVHPMQLVWLRYAVHLAILLTFGAQGSRLALVRTRYPRLQVGRSLLMLGMPLCWLLAAARMPMPSVMAIFWLNPIIAIIAAAILLGERPRGIDVVLIAAATAGVVLLLDPVRPRGAGGPILALGMSGCFALYVVATRWLRREPTSVNLFHSALGVFCVLTPVMPFIWRWPSGRGWVAILLIGALGLALLFFLDRAVHHATVARTAPIGFLQPVSEVLLFGSGFPGSAMRTVGLLIIACVVAVCVLRGRHAITETS